MLPTPKTKIAKVLHALAIGKIISEQDFRINRFRAILSDLRHTHHVPIRHIRVDTIDEFGRKNFFFKYFTLRMHQKKVIGTYLKINQ